MSFIQHYYEEQGEIIGPGENQVLCPFPHVASEMSYSETRASAHYNPTKGLFHCKACGIGMSEIQFIEKYFGCDKIAATKIADCFKKTDETIDKWDAHDDEDGLLDLEEPLNEETRARAHALGISDKAIRLMHMKTKIHAGWTNIMAFPVDIFGVILEHKYYHPYDQTHHKTPSSKKAWVRGGAPSGLVFPWSILANTPKEKFICICAGEKDVANMLDRGFNAVTVHGGEGFFKIVCPNLFKDRKVAILYDNDPTGITGAKKLATWLYQKGCRTIYNVTGHHDICVERGEDITDFFNKYNGTREELIEIIRNTELFSPESEDYVSVDLTDPNAIAEETDLPVITLYDATKPEHENKLVRSLVQVSSSEDLAYSVPTHAIFRKIKDSAKAMEGDWTIGEYKEWKLTPNNIEDVLHLIDENFTAAKIKENMKHYFAKRRIKETGISVDIHKRGVAFRATVQDFVEDKSIEYRSHPYSALILDTKLESGKKYMITYKVVPHAYKGGRKTMLVSKAEEAQDCISQFKITPQVIENLMTFQGKSVDEIARLLAPHIGFTPNLQLLKTIDFAFHTPLQFYLTDQFKRPQLLRATLDTLVIGESRIGKSATTKTAIEVYGLGQIVSLAGKSATVNGLIGGSTKVGSSDRFATKAGILPMNHKGLVVLEELGKASEDLMKELTDIRSSNRVRITRVDNSVDLPCMLRMIYLTNPKSRDGDTQSVESFPHGIEIVTGLVNAPEDIARFDNICVIGDKASVDYTRIEEIMDIIPPEVYRDRIRWIWSRTPEQVIITREADTLLRQVCNRLNAQYETHIKIFGTELNQKIARIAVAIAGYLVSTDETFETIQVLPEHINEAADYFRSLYDNPTFKIMRYVNDQKQYSEVTAEGTETLEMVFNKRSGASLVYALDQRSVCTLNELMANTGTTRDELNALLQPLLKACLIQFADQNKIRPTEKYRLTRPLIKSKSVKDLSDERLEF